MGLGKILVLAPHRDDEVLGCGGTLLKHEKALHIHYFNDTHPDVEKDVYDAEAEKVARKLNATTSYSEYMLVNALEIYCITDFITEIEELINDLHPKTVFVPAPDYNQDHEVVYRAAMTALRTHDMNWRVKNIWLYEQPATHSPAVATFMPQLFIPIEIMDKIELYGLYESQVRQHRSTSHVFALAQMRGMQCGELFAEAFQVVREVRGRE